MKKKIIIVFVLVFINSCIVFDEVRMLTIANQTCDTILIGKAFCNNIDSTKLFIQHDGILLYTDSMEMKENLWYDNSNLIYPDSFARTSINYIIKYKKGYFFIIKLETARNHTWAEICNEHLYDTLFVTRKMLEQGNRIEYHGNKTQDQRSPNHGGSSRLLS